VQTLHQQQQLPFSEGHGGGDWLGQSLKVS